jgi:ABC-type dipeptide/oligopeptide/nickel transport system permease subunit
MARVAVSSLRAAVPVRPAPAIASAAGVPSARRSTWARLRRHPDALAAAAVLLPIILAVLLAPLISPYDPIEQSSASLEPPSVVHWLGTDQLGRDTFSRVLHGGGPILVASLGAIALAGAAGVAFGLLAGYRGGWADQAVMRSVDMLLAFPTVLLAILMVTTLGPGLRQVMIAVAVSQLPVFTRMCRATALSVTSTEFVTAAHASGARATRVVAHHVLPNVLGVMLVQASLATAITLGYVGALSFVGLGVQPPDADWGTMISDATNYAYDAPWLAIAPGVAITIVVLCFNFLGDGVRDVLDPRQR